VQCCAVVWTAYPSNSVNVKAFLWYSASRISLYANGILAGVPSKKDSLNGKMYVSYHQLAMSSANLKVSYPIFVPVFAAQHPLSSWMCIVVPRSRNINEQSTRNISPSRINDVQPIRLLSIEIMRVHLQHIISAFWYARSLVVEDSHVVVGREVVHRRFGDLDIGIGIPW
jgi:hypothetical protein